MNIDTLFDATKTWAEVVREFYKNNNELTQIYMRGPFAGWSEREVLNLANLFYKNDKEYPLYAE